MGFDRPELLAQAGFDAGHHYSPVSQAASATESTTSSGMVTYDQNVSPIVIVPADVTPDGTLSLSISIRGDPNGDQIDIVVRNSTDGENAIEQTGILTGSGTQGGKAGPAEYTPTTTDSVIRLIPRFSNDDNATSVSLFDATVRIGRVL